MCTGLNVRKLAAVALGKTLFESAEYAARNRDNHCYVYDLYKTFLMRGYGPPKKYDDLYCKDQPIN